MQMDQSGSGSLTLLLSDEELAAFGLCFEDLDYRSPRTRRVVQALLRLARREIGYTPEGALLVEALPLEGGCLFLVTPEAAASSPPPGREPAVFRLPDGEALLQLAAAWRVPAHPIGESSSLYRSGEGFYLVLYGVEAAPVLYECGEALGEGHVLAALAAEHGTPLFIGDALPRLYAQTAS